MTHIEQFSSYASSPRSATSLLHLYNVWRSRRALAALDDAALKDVGLTRHDATRPPLLGRTKYVAHVALG